jgi:electron transfer flavoprotein alpha subunit
LTSQTKHDTWILAEQQNGHILPVSHELLARGRLLADKLAGSLTAVVLGDGVADRELMTLVHHGADRVLMLDAPQLGRFLVEPYAACLADASHTHAPTIVLAAATSTGRTLMPYLAAKIHTGLTADCTELDVDPQTGDLLQTRPAIGGNIMATIRTPEHRPQLATVRPHSTRPLAANPERAGDILRHTPESRLLRSRVRHLEDIPVDTQHALQDAEIVVSVGRGVRKADNVAVVEQLAEELGAALGASRDVVDRGWLSYPHQVGLSGKTVVPRLYVAVGISGAIQHLAGMQTAESVIAINSDPDAQIFRVADLGIVGDLFDIVPALVRRLQEERAS